uniref:Uncharacterized protein n=1 Tax=Trichuris muris TaxID=70415 RepID=A0A5S6QQ18_TRIMR
MLSHRTIVRKVSLHISRRVSAIISWYLNIVTLLAGKLLRNGEFVLQDQAANTEEEEDGKEVGELEEVVRWFETRGDCNRQSKRSKQKKKKEDTRNPVNYSTKCMQVDSHTLQPSVLQEHP